MKGKFIKLAAVASALLAAGMLSGCIFDDWNERDEKPEDEAGVNEIFANASYAEEIKRTVTLKEGNVVVSSEETVYSLTAAGADVTVTRTTLNPDLAATEEYVTETQSYAVAEEEVPSDFFIGDAFLTEDAYELTDRKFTCTVPASKADDFLGAGAKADSEVELELSIIGQNPKLYTISYTMESGRSVTIAFEFGY